MSLAATLVNLATTRDNYAAQLATDSASPLADYSLDGESVSREAWRDGLLRRIREINQTINELDSAWSFHARGAT